jgi:hypothetical protein
LIPAEMESRGLLVAHLVGTVVLAAVTMLAAFSQELAVAALGLAVSGTLFVGGCVAFAIGFLRAVGRSRYETIDLAGLFYLTASAPDPVRKAFLRLWFAQMAVAVAAVIVSRPPFAVMAPVWGIGLITWWASLHATFPPREDPGRR